MTRVYLHVGAPKTGTTYLQGVLFENRERLRRAGVLYPGDTADAHFRATLDVRGLAFAGYDDPRNAGAWGDLLESVRGWRGDAVVLSHELLGGSTPETIAGLVADLGPAEVHVVFTARDLGRQVPAVWQEMVKNGRTLSYESYLDQVTGARKGNPSKGNLSKGNRSKGKGAKVFWRQQDVAGVLGRWSEQVPAERVHLVTVPPPGGPPALLWQRFCATVGLDADRYDQQVPRTNVSLGLAEAELLRRVNVALDDRLEWPDYSRLVKNRLAQRVLAPRPDSDRARVPDRLRDWFDAAADEVVLEVSRRGYAVVGDLDDLRPHYGDGDAPDAPPDPAVTDAAAYALAELVVEQARRRGRTGRALADASARLRWLRPLTAIRRGGSAGGGRRR